MGELVSLDAERARRRPALMVGQELEHLGATATAVLEGLGYVAYGTASYGPASGPAATTSFGPCSTCGAEILGAVNWTLTGLVCSACVHPTR